MTLQEGGDGSVKGGGEDPLVLSQQLVGELVEVADPADHGGGRNDLVAVHCQLGQEGGVLGVALHQAVGGMAVVGPAHRAVLAEVVDADDRVAGPQQLRHQVAADEAGGAGDEDLQSRMPSPSRFQMSTTVWPLVGSPLYARWGAARIRVSASARTCSRGTSLESGT